MYIFLTVKPSAEFTTIIQVLLKTARFSQFWDEATKNRNILEVVSGKYI
jgi:hypothetical protein